MTRLSKCMRCGARVPARVPRIEGGRTLYLCDLCDDDWRAALQRSAPERDAERDATLESLRAMVDDDTK